MARSLPHPGLGALRSDGRARRLEPVRRVEPQRAEVVDLVAAYFNVKDIEYHDACSSSQHSKTCKCTIRSEFGEDLCKVMRWFSDNYTPKSAMASLNKKHLY